MYGKCLFLCANELSYEENVFFYGDEIYMKKMCFSVVMKFITCMLLNKECLISSGAAKQMMYWFINSMIDESEWRQMFVNYNAMEITTNLCVIHFNGLLLSEDGGLVNELDGGDSQRQ